MEKNPVDDMFARKLTDWQPQGSADLWDRIEARQEKVPRRLGWYWYAAASVALLVVVGYMVWQSEVVEIAGSKREVATVGQTNQPTRLEQPAKTIASDTASVLASNDEAPKAVSPNPITTQNRRVRISGEEFIVKSSEPVTLREKMEVAAIQKKAKAPESLIAENTEGTSLQPTLIQPGIVKETSPGLSTGRVVIAHVEPAPLTEEEPKNSKFIRVLRQLKNAKQGEAIEWDEVGFNPKKLMARADERLKTEEEKISRKYQELKDKTNL